MSKSKKMSLTKMFNNAAMNNLGFVNDAISPSFDSGKVYEDIKQAGKNLFGSDKDNYRQKQYENYLATIDRLRGTKTRLPGRVGSGLGTRTDSPTGRVQTVGRNIPKSAIQLNDILSKYQNRFLKLAQAKYYQRTTKA
jgi:hypothetical protein|tara:strand:- start:190 stop:603 length:414 start_codon:yes stop_codon:yes gene_type:complete